MGEINALLKEMLGKKMTKKQMAFQEVLRRKVKAGEITVGEAHRIWDREVLKEEKSDAYYRAFDKIYPKKDVK
jgi:hypothetical protein